MKVARALLKVVGAVLLACTLVVAGFWFFAPDLCANEVIEESLSPDGTKKLVVFQRDCGATTGFSTQVSVLASSAPLGNKSGNLFISDTDHGRAPSGPGGGPSVSVVWENPRSVVLTHHPKARVFKAETQIAGVRVRYVSLQ